MKIRIMLFKNWKHVAKILYQTDAKRFDEKVSSGPRKEKGKKKRGRKKQNEMVLTHVS